MLFTVVDTQLGLFTTADNRFPLSVLLTADVYNDTLVTPRAISYVSRRRLLIRLVLINSYVRASRHRFAGLDRRPPVIFFRQTCLPLRVRHTQIARTAILQKSSTKFCTFTSTPLMNNFPILYSSKRTAVPLQSFFFFLLVSEFRFFLFSPLFPFHLGHCF